MREKEAAEFLSVTPRTVRNYRRRGQLPFREVRGKTRPVIEYDRDDLERLKMSLKPRGRGAPSGKVRALTRVTFGLPPEDFEELAAAGRKLGLKPGEYARVLMREAMESRLQADIADLRTQDEKNAGDIRRLRTEISSAVEAILEYLGLSESEAKTWVGENLR